MTNPMTNSMTNPMTNPMMNQDLTSENGSKVKTSSLNLSGPLIYPLEARIE